MTSSIQRSVCAGLLLAATSVSWSFELPTHAAMTSAAVAQSRLTSSPNTSPLLASLGLVDHPNLPGRPYPPLGVRYIDIGSSLVTRSALGIEGGVIKKLRDPVTELTIPEEGSLVGWLMRGAIREDDNTRDTPSAPIGEGDEPGGTFNRVFGHFFDPYNDRGMTVGGEIGPRAVDWALNVNETIPRTIGTRKNHFKVADAREAMWRALTLTRIDGAGNVTDDVWPTDWVDASKEDLRKAYWATTFRALGDTVHVIQDMAQPQHTRNDIHTGLGCVPGVSACVLGHTSFFENYLEARTLKAGRFFLKEGFFGQNPRPDPILTNAGLNPVWAVAIKPGYFRGETLEPPPDEWRKQSARAYSGRDISLRPQDESKPEFLYGNGDEYCHHAPTREDAAAGAQFLKIKLGEVTRLGAHAQGIEAIRQTIERLERLPSASGSGKNR